MLFLACPKYLIMHLKAAIIHRELKRRKLPTKPNWNNSEELNKQLRKMVSRCKIRNNRSSTLTLKKTMEEPLIHLEHQASSVESAEA